MLRVARENQIQTEHARLPNFFAFFFNLSCILKTDWRYPKKQRTVSPVITKCSRCYKRNKQQKIAIFFSPAGINLSLNVRFLNLNWAFLASDATEKFATQNPLIVYNITSDTRLSLNFYLVSQIASKHNSSNKYSNCSNNERSSKTYI